MRKRIEIGIQDDGYPIILSSDLEITIKEAELISRFFRVIADNLKEMKREREKSFPFSE